MKKSQKFSSNTNDIKKIQDYSIFRPQTFETFIGQKKIKRNLEVFIQSSKKRKEKLDHILLYGPAGLGKTSLAYIIANEMKSQIKIIQAPILKKAGDLASHLTNLKDYDIFFIDEIHRLKIELEEILYTAMEDGKIDIMIGEGISAKSVRLSLSKFTLIGATTKMGLLSTPLQSRFSIIEYIEYYTEEEITQILLQSAKIIHIKMDLKSAIEIAKRSRGTPRIANNLLKRIRDFAEFENKSQIDFTITIKAFKKLEIDEYGLNKIDKKLLQVMKKHYNGGPVGIETLSMSIGESSRTIEEHYEPYLLQKGFLARTRSGRVLTQLAYSYLKNTN